MYCVYIYGATKLNLMIIQHNDSIKGLIYDTQHNNTTIMLSVPILFLLCWVSCWCMRSHTHFDRYLENCLLSIKLYNFCYFCSVSYCRKQYCNAIGILSGISLHLYRISFFLITFIHLTIYCANGFFSKKLTHLSPVQYWFISG